MAHDSGMVVGALLPDFTVQTTAGCTIYRRDFKGRQHLVIYFVADAEPALIQALTAAYPAWQAERAEVLLITAVAPAVTGPFSIIVDQAEQLRSRFGVGDADTLLIADRYGEVVLAVAGAAAVVAQLLPTDEILSLLERLEMQCAL